SHRLTSWIIFSRHQSLKVQIKRPTLVLAYRSERSPFIKPLPNQIPLGSRHTSMRTFPGQQTLDY
ncbi:unnamed protein product, partial [Candidula unifasciata]